MQGAFRLEPPPPKQGSSQPFIAIHQNCHSITALRLTLSETENEHNFLVHIIHYVH
ncbi:hypothetical protein I79_010537 [Cricetulus griseus]|uniref:Uncharacterized protein n=1 Tax=Cricetulus griseus TaxID=10029 RepID=G3HIR1_CRIGR|nr:hypothetical protein I79_010537 [Cricetulus griseus]